VSISPVSGCSQDPFTGQQSCSGTGGANCVYNQATGQYYSPLTGQFYGSYSQCANAAGTSIGPVSSECVVYNQATGQYYNPTTGQIYPSFSQCVSSTGSVGANCVVYNQTSGQYYNPATGQVYGSYSQCVSSTGTMIGSNCTQGDFYGNVDCPVPSLQPGTSVTFTVPLLVTAASGAVYGAVLVDPDNLVTESNRLNNTANFYVSVTPAIVEPIPPAVVPPPVALPPFIPPASEIPAPVLPPAIPSVVTPPPVAAPSAGGPWLHVLFATPAYSGATDRVWIAQPDEWYYTLRVEDGWALVVWEGDTLSSTEWIAIDPRVELVASDRSIPQMQLWLVVTASTQAYSVPMDPLWVAQPSEWYAVLREEDGWALVVWEHDPPDAQEWIQVDDRVELMRM
jgi:hypothetical protein